MMTFKRQRRSHMRIGERHIITIGQSDGLWFDVYHQAMTVGFPTFVLGTITVFLANNLIFALLFWLGHDPVTNVRAGDFLGYFFFSIETSITIGYGDMHPQSTYGHIIASLEGFTAMFQTAALTGLIFARFSRPRARLIFAQNPVVANYNGTPTLMIRLANARHNSISDATAVLWVLVFEYSAEGQRFRRFHRLPLTRHENPSFMLSWTLFHPINENSLLYGKTAEDLIREDVQFILTVKGVDETSAQELRARTTYTARTLLWGRVYADILTTDSNGVVTLDYAPFNQTVEETKRNPPSSP